MIDDRNNVRTLPVPARYTLMPARTILRRSRRQASQLGTACRRILPDCPSEYYPCFLVLVSFNQISLLPSPLFWDEDPSCHQMAPVSGHNGNVEAEEDMTWTRCDPYRHRQGRISVAVLTHSYGMIDDESVDKWQPEQQRPITFERRIEDVMIPKMREAGLVAQPDLVILSSLFWDERLLFQVSSSRQCRLYHLIDPPAQPVLQISSFPFPCGRSTQSRCSSL
jgi:hypothetical protein